MSEQFRPLKIGGVDFDGKFTPVSRDDLSALPDGVREAVEHCDRNFALAPYNGHRADWPAILAYILRLTRENDEWQTHCLRFQTERDKARVELAEARKTIKRLLGQNKIQYDFLSSRQCPDHAGKWERGKCLQCALEKAEAELADVRAQQEPPK